MHFETFTLYLLFGLYGPIDPNASHLVYKKSYWKFKFKYVPLYLNIFGM